MVLFMEAMYWSSPLETHIVVEGCYFSLFELHMCTKNTEACIIELTSNTYHLCFDVIVL